MPALSAIRQALADRLDTIPGLQAYPTARDQVNVPAAVVLPGGIDYDATLARGSDDFTFTVQLLVSQAVDRVAQDTLDGYLASAGTHSVKAAVDGDLDGTVHFARVATAGDYGVVEWHGVQFLGAALTVNVTAEGTV